MTPSSINQSFYLAGERDSGFYFADLVCNDSGCIKEQAIIAIEWRAESSTYILESLDTKFLLALLNGTKKWYSSNKQLPCT